jgi:hypothetical protein
LIKHQISTVAEVKTTAVSEQTITKLCKEQVIQMNTCGTKPNEQALQGNHFVRISWAMQDQISLEDEDRKQ